MVCASDYKGPIMTSFFLGLHIATRISQKGKSSPSVLRSDTNPTSSGISSPDPYSFLFSPGLRPLVPLRYLKRPWNALPLPQIWQWQQWQKNPQSSDSFSYGVLRHLKNLTLNLILSMGHPVLNREEACLKFCRDPCYWGSLCIGKIFAHIVLCTWHICTQNISPVKFNVVSFPEYSQLF